MIYLLEANVSADYLLGLEDLDTPIVTPLEIAWCVVRVEADGGGLLESVRVMLDGAPMLPKRKEGKRGAKEGSRVGGGRVGGKQVAHGKKM